MSKNRHSGFFLPFLFIGMGVGFILQQSLGGAAFAASMFIGMGLGFFLDSFLTIERKEIQIKNLKRSRILLGALGIIFILVGIIYFINPSLLEHFWTYLVAILFIIFGIYFLVKAGEKNR